jgi:hypothetical protein
VSLQWPVYWRILKTSCTCVHPRPRDDQWIFEKLIVSGLPSQAPTRAIPTPRPLRFWLHEEQWASDPDPPLAILRRSRLRHPLLPDLRRPRGGGGDFGRFNFWIYRLFSSVHQECLVLPSANAALVPVAAHPGGAGGEPLHGHLLGGPPRRVASVINFAAPPGHGTPESLTGSVAVL